MNNEYIIYRHTLVFTKTQKHKNAKEWAQNTKLAWGYAERRSISMMGHQNTKKMLLFHCFTARYVFCKEETLAFFRKKPAILSQNSRLTANFRICERTRTRKSRGHQPYPRNRRAIGPFITHCLHKNSLHPSRRMAWKNFRHGEAVNFLSPRKKTRQSLTNKHVPIKFYKISKNNYVFILL